MPRLRLALEWLIIFALAAMAAVGVAFVPGGQQLSNWMFDQELVWSERPSDPRILIAQIDEQSLASIGRWPWSRQVHADIIDRLTEAGAAAVGYDVLFTEPGDSADDAALAAALTRSKRVVLPAYAQFPGTNGKAFDVQMPIASIAAAARSIGHVNVLFDNDGQVRRARMRSAASPQVMPHLMQALAQIVQKSGAEPPEQLVVPFAPAGSIPAIPVDQILRGEVPASLLKGKIVLVGATSQGLGDLLPVSGPVGSVMPGVEVQANILNAILNGSWVRDTGATGATVIAVGLLLLVMTGYWRVTPNVGLAITGAIGIVALLASALALALLRVWVTPVPLLVALLVAYPLWNWRRLSALNAFVERETSLLRDELGEAAAGVPGGKGLDAIALAAARLRGTIGELRDRRSFLRNVIDGAPDALCVVDRQGRVVVANRHAMQIFGSDAEGALVATLLERISARSVGETDELTLTDGRTVLVKTAPFGAADVESAGSILRLADITERRNAERERDELLEFLSHDMRAPQAGILTVLATAKAQPDSPLPIERIRSYAAKSLKLADDFVQLARLSALAPKLEPVDPCGVFDEAIDGVFDRAASKRVTVTLDAPDDLPALDADYALLVRALGNLIENAVKYSPDGGTVACRVGVDQVTGESPGAMIYTIADNGPGIPPERMTDLFKRFGANDRSMSLSAGLGLAFVKKAVDLLGGTINCSSSCTGTTFRIALPIEPD